ncbi:helicase HerA domain-containing protein [Vulcanisaeta souniana]|uniref:Helicase HerA central domain-containing protein n=1 Tax=Vulcanisaeta souniana JCM 11219 TaxID=1293586 RepID=A0A830EI33_9CREN|nr:DUF87 domain-containing protein [Vulcanisaeta souniana]BDR91515.1 hypothetical protein Vsou_06080 [Vulcanisaeta souniana JCM 11219]GGI73758.1 hypothetical protein GCM10007112_08270 [Vulcanisaeta souniana JCM 11219]
MWNKDHVINNDGSSINKLYGDILGVIEKSINENNKLIMVMGTKLSYNELISKLFVGSYVVIIDKVRKSDVMIKVNNVESMVSPPPSISGAEPTYVKVSGSFVVTRIMEGDSYKYTTMHIIPTVGSLVIYPNSNIIKEFLGLGGDLVLGMTMINGYNIPMSLSNEIVSKGLLIIGQPGCGKSLLIKNIINGLYITKSHNNIVILDRTGEYPKDLVRHGIGASILMPMDLMKLNRPIDLDELRKYVIDKLRMLGFNGKTKITMDVSKENGIDFHINFLKQEIGELIVFPSSIRFRWFIERAINYLDPEIRYAILEIMIKDEKALSTIQSFISVLKDSELTNMVGKGSIGKAMELAYLLRDSGYFDALVNVGSDNIDLSIFSPIRVLKGRVTVIDLHELPESLMNIYETILIEDIIGWFRGSRNNRVVIVVDNAEGLANDKNVLSALISNMRIGKAHGVSFIVSTRVPIRKIYTEFGNIAIMRTNTDPLRLGGCQDDTGLLDKEFLLVSPLLNINCLKGSLA